MSTPDQARPAPGTITIPAPVVAFKGPADTDATMMRGAANRLASGYPVGGSNMTRAVETVLRDIADALEGRPVGQRSSEPVPAPTISTGELVEMTYAQRRGLPAVHHRPHFDDLSEPASWVCSVCSVCWDDGETNAWPCTPTTTGGRELADLLGLGISR